MTSNTYKLSRGNKRGSYGIPLAIIGAGALIALAVVFSSRGAPSAAQVAAIEATAGSGAEGFRLPSADDHSRGATDATVTIVEFGDFQCPFCARLHPTLARIVEEQPDVRWVYRHFPLNSHTRAFEAAVVSECIAEFGGNEAFWKFTDAIFIEDRGVGEKFYAEFAKASGIDSTTLTECRERPATAVAVQTDLNEVIAVGGRGTPFVVVVTASGKLTTFSGALPYEQVAALVARARAN